MYQLLRFPFNQFFPSFLFALSRQLGEIYKTLRAHWMVSQPKQYYHRIWKHTWMCFLVFRIHTCVKSITKECMKTSNIFIKDGRGTRWRGGGLIQSTSLTGTIAKYDLLLHTIKKQSLDKINKEYKQIEVIQKVNTFLALRMSAIPHQILSLNRNWILFNHFPQIVITVK